MADARVAALHDPDWPARWLAERLALVPARLDLYRAALTHRSASGANNERLEFLGDAVLNLVIARRLFERFPQADEGDLSRLRARLVSGPPLAELAATLQLGAELVLGGGELKTGGFRRESILADALEAVLGAVFLDQGFEAAEGVILTLFRERIDALPAPSELKDAKTRLQEYLQGRGLALPDYQLTSVSGEPHDQHFTIRASIRLPARQGGAELTAGGEGRSRRRAEQAAAQDLLAQIQERQP